MWPTLIDNPAFPPLHTYGLFILLAFTAGFVVVHFRARKVGIHPEKLIGTYVAAAVGGIIGARLLFARATDWQALLDDPWSLFGGQGLAYYGGVIGGAVGVLAVCRIQGIHAWKFADVVAPALVLANAIGRLGCFFGGCCHGAAAPVGRGTALLPPSLLKGQLWLHSEAPFLTNEVYAGVGRLHGVPLYPTQLWSTALGVGIAGLLMWSWRFRKFDGQTIALLLMTEPIARITVEAYRADERGYWRTFDAPRLAEWFPGMTQAGTELQGTVGVTTSQGIGLLMILTGISIWIWRRRIPLAPEEPIDDEDWLDVPEHG